MVDVLLTRNTYNALLKAYAAVRFAPDEDGSIDKYVSRVIGVLDALAINGHVSVMSRKYNNNGNNGSKGDSSNDSDGDGDAGKDVMYTYTAAIEPLRNSTLRHNHNYNHLTQSSQFKRNKAIAQLGHNFIRRMEEEMVIPTMDMARYFAVLGKYKYKYKLMF